MEFFNQIIQWHVEHQPAINLFKDVVFLIGVVVTFYGYGKIAKYFAVRNTQRKRLEMEYDAELSRKIKPKLTDYVNDYKASPTNLRDIGIRLLYIKNYPYNLNNDGYRFMLHYYFMTARHNASGYVTGKAIYIVDHLKFMSQSIYFNEKNDKWFIRDKGHTYRGYAELAHTDLLKQIPFANMYGCDFESEWAEKGEPVFYTKYKYNDWRLFGDDLQAITQQDGGYPRNILDLKKNKRAKKIGTWLISKKLLVKLYFKTKAINTRAKKK